MSKGKKKPAPPSRQPATKADVKRAEQIGISKGCRLAVCIMFTVLLDKENMDADDLQRIWSEVEYLSDSVAKGYVSADDMAKTLSNEYGIDIWKE